MAERALSKQNYQDLRALAKNGPCWQGVAKGVIPSELYDLMEMELIELADGAFNITSKGLQRLLEAHPHKHDGRREG